ncbi:MAG: hypothetical protein AAF713_00515 [Pseudomonadota bacterium]
MRGLPISMRGFEKESALVEREFDRSVAAGGRAGEALPRSAPGAGKTVARA